MNRAPLRVKVVAADREVWSGEAVNIIARTTEGDIGILPGHEPILAALVPSAVTIITADGEQEVIAVDGGFIGTGCRRSPDGSRTPSRQGRRCRP